MIAKRLNVAIVAGGDSSEAEVSRRSAKQVLESLPKDRYQGNIVEVSSSNWHCNGEEVDLGDFSTPTLGKFDYALIMVHGTPGENGPLQGYFELMNIPYSTSNSGIMAITFDKKLCKRALRDTRGINLAKEVTLRKGDNIDLEEIITILGLPFFVKPTQSGSSFGVSKVRSRDEFQRALDCAFSENSEVMCEEFIEGVEVSQGVMICSSKEYILPITELVTTNDFFDYEAKYTEGLTQEITPARIPDEIAQRVSQATITAYRELNCRGVIRIDYIIRDGVPYFIEVNGTPGMSAQSIIPQQWAAIGLTMGEAFSLIIDSTI